MMCDLISARPIRVGATHHAFSPLLAIGVVWLLVVSAHSETRPTVGDSTIKVGETSYKVVDRVVIGDAVVFRKPLAVKEPPCTVRRVTSKPEPKGCIPSGRVSYGILGCGPLSSQQTESISQTFARVPGKDAPNLFASIVGMHVSRKRTDGTLLVAIIACGPRIAVPVAAAHARSPTPPP